MPSSLWLAEIRRNMDNHDIYLYGWWFSGTPVYFNWLFTWTEPWETIYVKPRAS